MFSDDTLKSHLETSSVIKSQSAVIAEWNMNVASNISAAGNYRHRPTETGSPYRTESSSFDALDVNNEYTGATDNDIVIDGGTGDDNLPMAFKTKKEKEALLYSLEDCFGKFRPRSGINKLRFFNNKYTHHSNPDMAERPRYYIADRTDPFKYWTSYRTEDGVERGIANKIVNNQYYIDDASPFVVYKEAVPANRIVVKMQTNVGTIDLGPFSNSYGTINDPFYGAENKSTPVRWKIQYLDVKNIQTDNGFNHVIEPNWVDAYSFTPDSVREDGTPIIKEDGYLELSYGLIVPNEYKTIFYYAGNYASQDFLPDPQDLRDGLAYLVRESDADPGRFYMVVSGGYISFAANYDWIVGSETVDNMTHFVTELVSPETFTNNVTGQVKFREMQYIGGIRIVVDTMNKFDSSLDIIEISPRLSVNLAGKVKDFSVTKSASDLGISGMPVGQLLAGTGKVTLFDYDQAFFTQNTDSVVSKFLNQNIQFKLYEVIADLNGYDYYVPIKTMYSEGFPEVSSTNRMVTISLRDLFFYLESITAPQILIQNASLSYAISLLLDYVGFSNYSFKRNPGEEELVIPYFMVGPDKSVAEVLNELAVSAQSAMFFDEYNNFIVMSKGYMMPSVSERTTDVTLYGSNDFARNGVLKNEATKSSLANIIELSSMDNHVYNDGLVQYTTRYIQRSYGSVKQANLVDRDKTWIYKPALLWEVSASENTKSKNEEVSQQQSYVLGAIPLNSDLTDKLPSVSGHKVVNNVIDLGEGIYWLPRYNGYLYANGEVIKYDAVQFSIPGLTAVESLQDNVNGDTVWITSTQEYQRYFAKVPFNGKIYPTGLVRIYSEPNYEVVNGATRLKNGPVAKHGRMQFGTGIRNADGTMSPVYHNAGVSQEWISNDRVRGLDMESKYLFNTAVNKQIGGVYSDSVNRGTATIETKKSIPAQLQTITGGTSEDTVLNIKLHGFNNGDMVYLSTTGALPTGMTVNKLYYVVGASENSLKLSETLSGSALQINSAGISAQSGSHSIVLVNSSSTITSVSVSNESPAKFTKAGHGLVTGQPIYFSSVGSAVGFNAGIVYHVVKVDDDVFKIEAVAGGDELNNTGSATTLSVQVLAYPAKITCNGHRFIVGDRVKFSTNGELPSGIDTTSSYFVVQMGLTQNSFVISSTSNGTKISGGLVQSGTHSALIDYTKTPSGYSGTLANWEKSRIVVPDASFLQTGLFVEKESGTGSFQDKTTIQSIDVDRNTITLSKPVLEKLVTNYVNPETGLVTINTINVFERAWTAEGPAGVDNLRAQETTRNGIIKNFLSNIYVEESTVNRSFSTQSGTVQSSAFIMNGSAQEEGKEIPTFVSYVYKPLEDRFVHFGTRMRIVGTVDNNEYRGQTPTGAKTYYVAQGSSPEKETTVGGSSGGIAIMVDPATNHGYYFEIAALTSSNAKQYTGKDLHNMLFYKIKRNASATSDKDKAIPVKLWGGTGNIIVDDGKMTGQYRMAAEENPTVYDIAVEYQRVGNALRFFLYVNEVLVATVNDEEPLEVKNNMALFIRSSSRVMFENVYALTNNYSQNTTFSLDVVSNGVFSDLEVNASNSFRKYALSGLVQSTYLSGISSTEPPKYKIYFEEFGTIMREAAYFNVRYDKAYPAIYATMSPTFNKVKGYTVSGFIAGAYKAEFLLFNNTDSALNFDSTSGNYLRIQGITFTQQSAHELSVDDFYSKKSDMSNPQFLSDENVLSSQNEKKLYQDIKFSRMTYGKKQFSVASPYIQNADEAEALMGWLSNKIMKPRKSVGVKVFGMPTLQLGDIVEVDYTNSNGIQEVASDGTRFVVYSIDYSRGESGPDMTVYLSEVV